MAKMVSNLFKYSNYRLVCQQSLEEVIYKTGCGKKMETALTTARRDFMLGYMLLVRSMQSY